MSDKSSVLIIDDEIQIRRFLRFGLEAKNYSVIEASTGKDGLYQAAVCHPAAVILDLGLPDIDGCEVLVQLRQWTTIPVLVLSVRNDESEKIACFDNGCDDYITKPFAMGEFLARLRSVIRRSHYVKDEPVFRNGDLVVDIAAHCVSLRGKPVQLSPTEYNLLVCFAKHAGKVLTHRQIIRDAWGPYYENESRSLRVYIRMLRKKLELDPDNPQLIITEPSVGYRMTMVTAPDGQEADG